MSLKVAFKLVSLLTALTATVVAIYWLKQGHMNSFWTSLGLQEKGSRLNWCEERVDTLYFYNIEAKLTEKEGQWMWVTQKSRPLDYMMVEKWFAKYCQVSVTQPETMQMIGFTPIFEAKFINGERLTLQSNGKDLFQIRDQIFRSETLRKAVKELLAFGGKIE